MHYILVIVVIILYDKYTLVCDGCRKLPFPFSLHFECVYDCDIFYKHNITIQAAFYSEAILAKNPIQRVWFLILLKITITNVVFQVLDCNCLCIASYCLFIAILFKLRPLHPAVSSKQKTIFNYIIFVRIQ